MSFEWDEDKRAANLEKHGVDFALAEQGDWQEARTLSHMRDGEFRLRTYIRINERLHVIVWAPRGGNKRIISLRKANRREQAAHG